MILICKYFIDYNMEKDVKPRLTETDFEQAAQLLHVEKAVIKAVQQVETNGNSGFLPSGQPTIFFEGHVFWKQLKNNGLDPTRFVKDNEDILYPAWTKQFYKGGIKEYDRLNKAIAIHEDAALASTCWGMFQIMGSNYSSCRMDGVKHFVETMRRSEACQLELFCHFIPGNKLAIYLQNKDWAVFARRYNGPGYAKNHYDTKLAEAYQHFINQ